MQVNANSSVCPTISTSTRTAFGVVAMETYSDCDTSVLISQRKTQPVTQHVQQVGIVFVFSLKFECRDRDADLHFFSTRKSIYLHRCKFDLHYIYFIPVTIVHPSWVMLQSIEVRFLKSVDMFLNLSQSKGWAAPHKEGWPLAVTIEYVKIQIYSVALETRGLQYILLFNHLFAKTQVRKCTVEMWKYWWKHAGLSTEDIIQW